MRDSSAPNDLRRPAVGPDESGADTGQPAAGILQPAATGAVVASPVDPDEARPPGVAHIHICKAGCGFRFDPDTLEPDTGFDFSAATSLLDALVAVEGD